MVAMSMCAIQCSGHTLSSLCGCAGVLVLSFVSVVCSFFSATIAAITVPRCPPLCLLVVCLSGSRSVLPFVWSFRLSLSVCPSLMSCLLFLLCLACVPLSNSCLCMPLFLFGCRSDSHVYLPQRTTRQTRTCPPRPPAARGPPPVGGSEVWKAPRWTQLTRLGLALLISERSWLVRPVGRATREGEALTSIGVTALTLGCSWCCGVDVVAAAVGSTYSTVGSIGSEEG